jgi:LysM repeat protein
MKMPTSRHLHAALVGVAIASFVAVVSAGYVVQRGDTLADIAAEHDTTVSALVEANSIANPNLIRVGQVLELPGQAQAAAVPATHTVTVGDTLGVIAVKYGTTVARIAELNGIANPNVIRLGSSLAIPGTAPAEDSSASQASDEAMAGSETIAPSATTHVVRSGESLALIARKYGVTTESLAAANGITNVNLVFSGTTLVISDTPAAVITGTPGATSVHQIAAGETLAALASRYGTSVQELAETNSIANPNLIRAGQELTVPAPGWVCPVAGARYFNDWGFPRSGGRFHQGNDLFAPRGTEVRAPVSGTVELKTGTIGGLQFWMEGDDGNLYIGTHMDAFGVGGPVQAGQVIGYVGDSGNAIGSSPHLHLEIHVNGSPVNPYPTLKANGC